jgi:hypothetical protein
MIISRRARAAYRNAADFIARKRLLEAVSRSTPTIALFCAETALAEGSAAPSVVARPPPATIAVRLAGSTRRMAAGPVVEITARLAVGDATRLAALPLVLADLFQPETPRAEAIVTQSHATVVGFLAGLVDERATTTGDARLLVEVFLAAVCRRLAAPPRVLAAGVVLADAKAAAITLVGATILQAVTTAVAGRLTARDNRAIRVAALVVVRVAALLEGQAGALTAVADALFPCIATGAVAADGGAAGIGGYGLAITPAARLTDRAGARRARHTRTVLTGIVLRAAVAIGIAAGVVRPRLLDAGAVGRPADAAVARVIFTAAINAGAGGTDAVLATIAGGAVGAVGIAARAVLLRPLATGPVIAADAVVADVILC